ncbi:MAG: glutamate-5-semialdehyde dehydrogenase, partial [Actinobacteria bacterium]
MKKWCTGTASRCSRSEDHVNEVIELAKKAKAASHALSTASSKSKDAALCRMADALERNTDKILAENERDMAAARERKISSAMMDRLLLTDSRVKAMADGLREVATLRDPVGEVIRGWRRPNGLVITQVRTTLGVIGMVYEARPNVTVDAAGLCLKAGSSALMRGGSEAIHSNVILARILSDAAGGAGMPDGCIQLVESTERRAVLEMLKLNEYIDLVIPRGGSGLIQTVVENSTIPVIKHFRGLTHTYVDKSADIEMATRIVNNAKTQRASTCNALETLNAGVTTVRDAGGTPQGFKMAIERGLIPGPRMRIAVSILSQSGGHGDSMMPSGVRARVPWGPEFPNNIVDGPDEVRRATRELLRAGADFIKLCSTGGVLSPADEPGHSQFTPAEIDV